MQPTDAAVTEEAGNASAEETSVVDSASAQETPTPWTSKVIGALLVLLCLAVVIGIVGLEPVAVVFVLLVLYVLLR